MRIRRTPGEKIKQEIREGVNLFWTYVTSQSNVQRIRRRDGCQVVRTTPFNSFLLFPCHISSCLYIVGLLCSSSTQLLAAREQKSIIMSEVRKRIPQMI
jgi:hypothetical protein